MTHIWPQTPLRNIVHNVVMVDKITVVTNANGAASNTGALINGEILKVAYDKGNVTTSTNVALKTTTGLTGAVVETIDTYDVNTGSTFRYPRTVALGSDITGDGTWIPFVVHDTLTASVSGGQASKTCHVYVYYR